MAALSEMKIILQIHLAFILTFILLTTLILFNWEIVLYKKSQYISVMLFSISFENKIFYKSCKAGNFPSEKYIHKEAPVIAFGKAKN
jgi:hypothetical protein